MRIAELNCIYTEVKSEGFFDSILAKATAVLVKLPPDKRANIYFKI